MFLWMLLIYYIASYSYLKQQSIKNNMGIIGNDIYENEIKIMGNFWEVLEGIIGKNLSILGSGSLWSQHARIVLE